MLRAWSNMVSEKDEKYTYSRNILSGGTVSVIWTSVQAGQKTSSSGKVSGDNANCTDGNNEFASGVCPRDRIIFRSLALHDRQRIDAFGPSVMKKHPGTIDTNRLFSLTLRRE